ncbi:MAG TPA: T9SS type A sorting domain-containing protein [Panacibacter sp.]|nr:T9SS type A sorting domain-containing protein [Panacibacter sp.]HNP44821.1 T9SS type A sorting domain-containing protein [Panacibacter sp.]
MKKLSDKVFLALYNFRPKPNGANSPAPTKSRVLGLRVAICLLAIVSFFTASAQVTLTNPPYSQTFNSISSGLPTGWTVRTGATGSALGTSVSAITAATAWSTATGQFANYASANSPAGSADNSTTQSSRSDRALGVRQTSVYGDPGVAFVLQITNTTGLSEFSLTFKLMNLDPTAGKSTAWKVDYGFGASPSSFTDATTSPANPVTGNSGAWGPSNGTTVTVNFGASLDNKSGPVWIRIVTKSATGGTGNTRPVTAIDDYNLNWYKISTTSTGYGPYCVTTATGSSSFNIPVTTIGTFNSGNIYTAQLSNASGSFSSPVTIGTLTSTANSGNIPVTIPAGLSGGSGYRVRVISSNPSLTSADNGSNITINAISGQPSDASVCIGSSATFTVSNSGSPTYQWQESPDQSTWSDLSNGIFSGTTYGGATTATLSVSGSNSRYYRCNVTYSGCTLTTSSAHLVYNALPLAPPAPTTPYNPVCETATLTESSAITGVSYFWQGTTLNGTSTANNASIPASVSASGTYYVRAQNNSSGCWSSGSGSINVTINSAPAITTQPVDKTLQVYSSATFSVVTSAINPSYSWQYSADGSTNWTAVVSNTPNAIMYSGSTSANLIASTNINFSGTYYYRCIIAGTNGCNTISNIVRLTLAGETATNTVPFSIGKPCGSSGDSIMYFTYDRTGSTLSRLTSCKPYLASPGLSSTATSVSFNPADGYLYLIRFQNSSGVYTSYVWRWLPGSCPGSAASPLPVYKTYSNQLIAGLDFDQTGIGYQIVFTGSSAPYGMALQQVDFATNTFGPIENIDLGGKNVYTQNGDLVMIDGYSFMVWDNKYFSLNYQDYNTATALKATFIDTLAVPGNAKIVGLAYAQGKMVASASNCSYYDFNIINGRMTSLGSNAGVQYSTDMSNITSGVGAAKRLVSSTPVSAGVYDLVYDITVKNYGDYPISNLQVLEDLTTIHPSGASVISNVSTEWVINPANIIKNSSFDGVNDKYLISSSPAQSLPNFPASQSGFIIRVKFRLSSVVAGTEYNNNAVVTGYGYNSTPLFDSSTNGKNPDRNGNFRPDDKGESQATTFSISMTADFPPCSVINNVLYNTDFGAGSGNSSNLPAGITNEYAFGINPMDEETYVLTDNANKGNSTQYVNLADHTGNTNGKMLLVNADVNNYRLFQTTVSVPCSNLRYSFGAYAANAINSAYTTLCTNAFGQAQYPNLTFVVRNATDSSIIAAFTTASIADSSWNLYGLKWVMPAGITKVKLQIYNTGEGGCGNVVALDDIQFGICDPQPIATANGASGCLGTPASLSAVLYDTTGIGTYLQYQWQSSTGLGYSNIAGATGTNYSIPSFGLANPPYYRILVEPLGNAGNVACQSFSNIVYLPFKDSSVPAITATKNVTLVCPGQSVTLSVFGGSLGANASWKWYQSSCGGTFVDSGHDITVTPSAFTTYYVRAEGECNTTPCAAVAVPVGCILAEEAITLKGAVVNQFANLSWNVVADSKIKNMLVERSANGTSFTSIGNIDVNGLANSSGYRYTDNLTFFGYNVVYYRIKVGFENGNTGYSKILKLPVNTEGINARVVPNPAKSKASLVFYLSDPSNLTIRLYNATSQMISSHDFYAQAGLNTYDIAGIAKLSAGIYFINLSNADIAINLKLIVQ